MGRFGILGIDGPLVTPTENQDGFKNDPVFKGVVPQAGSHQGRFAVLLEPLANGAAGSACISGVCSVKLNVAPEAQDFRFADVAHSQTGYLQLVSFGSAAVLWREPGAGEKWARVHLNAALARPPRYAKVTQYLEDDLWMENQVKVQPCYGAAGDATGEDEVNVSLTTDTGTLIFTISTTE